MIAEEKDYDYYAENITKIALEHDMILPGEENDFARFVRGC